MLAGIQHKVAFASCIPYSSLEMKSAIKAYGFEYRTLLGQFQHLCQWTRLDIQTAVQRLAKNQNAPGMLHFEGLLQIAIYLRRYPDLLPLTFNRNIQCGSVISIAHEITMPHLLQEQKHFSGVKASQG